MPIEVFQINLSQQNKILKAEENHFLDLKAIDILPSRQKSIDLITSQLLI